MNRPTPQINTERILDAYHAALRQSTAATRSAQSAVWSALYVGQLLIEAKAVIGHGPFSGWCEEKLPEISLRTAQRWMAATANIVKALDLTPNVTVRGMVLKLSEVIAPDQEPREKAALAARQAFLACVEGKTLKELSGVMLYGDDPRRIANAHNGRTLGGGGGDRKAWDQFIARKLSDVSAHLGHWKSFTPEQVEYTQTRFAHALEKWPTPLLEALRKQLGEELKRR